MAEAEAEEKNLRGKGIAQMRANMIDGWVSSIAEMSEKTKQDPKDVTNFLVRVLELETKEVMSKQADTKVIFMPDKTGDLSVLTQV